jgi:hypothetical protein
LNSSCTFFAASSSSVARTHRSATCTRVTTTLYLMYVSCFCTCRVRGFFEALPESLVRMRRIARAVAATSLSSTVTATGSFDVRLAAAARSSSSVGSGQTRPRSVGSARQDVPCPLMRTSPRLASARAVIRCAYESVG